MAAFLFALVVAVAAAPSYTPRTNDGFAKSPVAPTCRQNCPTT
jgi:hypothetical protein